MALNYARMLKQLLPPGQLFEELDATLSGTLQAVGDELARVEQRGADLIEESDPRTATETLEDWERLLGLPDSAITDIPATDAERRLAITQAMIRQGGQHAAFYVALAAACGYTVTITDGFTADIPRAGIARAGDRCGSVDLAYRWEIEVSPPSGDALSHDELEAIITRAAPSHTVPVFIYL